MKNKEIQGLRAIAVLGVVLYHAHFAWIPGGFLGVDVFFVISGFLITQMLLKELSRTSTINFPAFYARRLRRLLPTAVIVVITTIGVGRHLISPLRFKDLGLDGIASIFYGANYRFYYSQIDYLNLGSKPSLLLHFWSLAVEEQFYFIWPLLIFVGYKLFKKWGAFTLLLPVLSLSFFISLKFTSSNPTLAFYSLQTRAWEFAVGSMTCFAVVAISKLTLTIRTLLGWTGLAILTYGLLTIKESQPFPGYAALIPTLATALVIFASSYGRFIGSFLITNPIFYGVGAISYSLYLWHWPIYQLEAEVLGQNPTGQALFGYLILTFTFTLLSYFLIEKPVRNYHRMAIRAHHSFITGGLISAVGVLTAVSIMGLNLFPSSTVNVAAANPASVNSPPATPTTTTDPNLNFLASPSPSADQTLVTAGNFPEGTSSPISAAVLAQTSFDGSCELNLPTTAVLVCDRGAITSKHTIAIFGDSHAEQWLPALNEIGLKYNYKISIFSKAGCPAPKLLVQKVTGGTANKLLPYPECATWRAAVIAKLQAAPAPDLLLLAAVKRYNDGKDPAATNAYWIAGYEATINALKSHVSNIAIFNDTPYPGTPTVPDCLAHSLSYPATCNIPYDKAVTLDDRLSLLQGVASKNGVHLIDPIPWLCNYSSCPAVIGGTVAYKDESHLAAAMSLQMVPQLETAILPLLGINTNTQGQGSPTPTKLTSTKPTSTSTKLTSTPTPTPTPTPTKSTPTPTPIKTNRDKISLSSLQSGIIPDMSCELPYSTVEPKICVRGDLKGSDSIAIFGDSKAEQWLPALDLIGKKSGKKVYVFSKSACPSATLAVSKLPSTAPYIECEAWRAQVVTLINKVIHPSLIILTADSSYGSKLADPKTYWAVGYSQTVQNLNNGNARIVILDNTPNPGFNAPNCLSKNLDDVTKCTFPRSTGINEIQSRTNLAALSQVLHVGYIDPTFWICPLAVCPTAMDGILFYSDWSHISVPLSVRLAANLEAALLNI